MTNSKGTLAWLVLALLLSSPAFAGRHSLSTTTEGDGPITDCDQIKIRFGDADDPLPMARAERQLGVSASEARSLAISLQQSNGVTVLGGAREDYSIKACMAAGGRSLDAAKRALDGVHVTLRDGRLTATADAEYDWMVYLIVNVPASAGIELQAENGPIDVRGMTGSVVARNQNGPVSLTGCSGESRVDSQNGPISTSNGGGRQRLRAQNGPISIALTGGKWRGPGLEAHAENGPLSLALPGGYESGVRIEMSDQSPVSCRAAECRDARKTWDDRHRRIEFGGDEPIVLLSTRNGPVSVTSRGVEL